MPLPPDDLVPAGVVAEELLHNARNEATGGIWRVPREGGSAVLKLATPAREGSFGAFAASSDPGHWNFWRREVHAYESGFVAAAFADAGLTGPRLLDVVERADGSVALWLEDVRGTPGMGAGTAALGDVAQRIGSAQARWLGDPPRLPWLSRDFLRDYPLAQPVERDLDWAHPAVTAVWSPPLRATLREVWERRHDLIGLAAALPRTLCHHDLWPLNVIVADRGPVLLDWAFTGPGPIGADPANLILDAFWDGMIDPAALPEVAATVIDCYRRGLGPVGDVAYAIKVTGVVKYFWLAPLMVSFVARQRTGTGYDTRDAATMLAGRTPVFALLAAWARDVLR